MERDKKLWRVYRSFLNPFVTKLWTLDSRQSKSQGCILRLDTKKPNAIRINPSSCFSGLSLKAFHFPPQKGSEYRGFRQDALFDI